MMNLSTALSAIRANQVALQVVGNNIANANSPDYHRQEVRFVDKPPLDDGGVLIGQGVDIAKIQRAYDRVTEAAITQNVTEQSWTGLQLGIATQIETMLTPGQGTVLDRLEELFNQFERFTANADNSANRSIVVRNADSLAAQVSQLARHLDNTSHLITQEIYQKIDTINSLAAEIVDANLEIRSAEIRGKSPNDLLDHRDRLVNELAKIVDAEVVEIGSTATRDGVSEPILVLSLAGGQIRMTDTAVELGTVKDGNGRVLLCRKGGTRPIDVRTGELGALFDARDNLVAGYQVRLDEFTQGLVNGFDRVHTAGLGTAGTFEQLNSHRFIEDVNQPLSLAETIVPIEAGELAIAITDANGIRVMEQIAIDPAVDSLEDVAARIRALDHVQAIVVSPPGQITISADPGASFDFMASRPGAIDTTQITGTTIPTIQGHYDGDTNQQYSFEFASSGTIGMTPDLRVNVRDAQGAIVGDFVVGEGYRVGANLELGDGITIRLSAGDVAAGDRFATDLIQTPDATGFLAATGLNTLFTGKGAHDLRVSAAILNDHSLLATTRSGDPQDSLNAEAMANLRHNQFMNQGDQSLEEFFADVIGAIGTDVLDLQSTQETLTAIGESLEIERAGRSGVDVNEEAVKMLQFQRAFQSTARYISAVDEMFQTLIAMIR